MVLLELNGFAGMGRILGFSVEREFQTYNFAKFSEKQHEIAKILVLSS